MLEGDKDGSAIVMSVQCYKREIEIPMDSVLNGSKVYQTIDDAGENEKWGTKDLSWHRTLQELVVAYAPSPQLAKTGTEFFAAQKKPRLPCFRLLVKTHKSTRLNHQGAFALRPLVGVTRWGTTCTSILLAVTGKIFWKLDRLQDPMGTPLSDTVDLIEPLSKRGFLTQSYVCTTCNFSAL